MGSPLFGYEPKYELSADPVKFAREAVRLIDRAIDDKLSRKEVAWAISHGRSSKTISDEPQLRRVCHLAFDVGEYEQDIEENRVRNLLI